MKNGVLAILASLLLVSCGGGGTPGDIGSTATAPSDVSFLTTSPDIDDVGESQSFNLAGTTTGNSQSLLVSASYTITRKPNEQQGDEEVMVYDAVFVVSIPSRFITELTAVTSYSTLDGTLLLQRFDTGVECYPNANYTNIPATVRIGESGVTGSIGCSDGMTISGSYLVEQSDRGAAWAAIRSYATTSAPGAADIFEDIVVHISPDGRVHALDIDVGDGEITVVLRS